MGPRVVSVLATRSATSAGFVTSAIWQCTGIPMLASPCSESSSAARSRPQIDTEAPSIANWRAIARPIPRLPPVTSATPPARGYFPPGSPFDLLIRAMRILPCSGHSFFATVILSLEFPADLRYPGGGSGDDRNLFPECRERDECIRQSAGNVPGRQGTEVHAGGI